MIHFTDTVPPVAGRTTIDKTKADELLDALIDNPNKWAEIPITWLVPDLNGAEEKRLKSKTRNLANRINNRADIAPFNEYDCEAKARETTLYIRVRISERQLKDLY